MKGVVTCICLLFVSLAHTLGQGNFNARVGAYIEKYKDVAMAEQQRVGIPASITLAQAIIESEAGESRLAKEGNNHFGLKCKNDWGGDTLMQAEDDNDLQCYKKYTTVKESYEDHSNHIKKNKRYTPLFSVPLTNYSGWAMGLQDAGYATEHYYGQRLTEAIENYKLQQYTIAAMDKKDDQPDSESITAMADKAKQTVLADEKKDVDTPILYNGLKAFYAHKGDLLLEYATKHKVRYARLLEMNDLEDGPLPYDMYIYLERKHLKGNTPIHVVKEGETMQLISQEEGIMLKRLLGMNHLEPGDEAPVGTTLYLQATAKVTLPSLTRKPVPHKPKPAEDTAAVVAPPATDTVASSEAPANKEVSKVVEFTPGEKPIAKADQPASVDSGSDADETPEVQVSLPATNKSREMETMAKLNGKPQPAAAMPTPVSTTHVIKVEGQDAPTQPQVPQTQQQPETQQPASTQQVQQAVEPEEADTTTDELTRLKHQLDKIVYAHNRKQTHVPASTTMTPKQVNQQSATTVEKAEAGNQNNSPNAKASTEYYTVKEGDTAFNIAKAHHITVRQLMKWNNLDYGEIKAGQKLIVKQ
jgi:LysM repeat protein